MSLFVEKQRYLIMMTAARNFPHPPPIQPRAQALNHRDHIPSIYKDKDSVALSCFNHCSDVPPRFSVKPGSIDLERSLDESSIAL